MKIELFITRKVEGKKDETRRKKGGRKGKEDGQEGKAGGRAKMMREKGGREWRGKSD